MPSPRGAAPPPCRKLGPQCHGLPVILRVSHLEAGADSGDHEATWLLGHTDRIDFGELWRDEDELYVDAVLRVPCRWLATSGATASCRAHGFTGAVPRSPGHPDWVLAETARRRLGGNRFRLVERGRVVDRTLESSPAPRRALPVVPDGNPCATAPCRTADHVRGAACCRDLQIEIMCTRKERRLEALIRSRKSPYLCKVDREGDYSIGAEMISACGYLMEDGIHCGLHGRVRADGRPAKPDLCSTWPEGGDLTHPGCAFARSG